MWAGKARTRSRVLLALPKCWDFSAVRPWAPAPSARQGSNMQECWLSFPVGLEVPSQLLSCLLWGQTTRWVCTQQYLAPAKL